jgi:2-polyprenyl-6-methoxyphenol hydroxylase-like FAD-dependent oxidoreductase
MAGLAAARVLSDHFGEVTVLERDELVDHPQPRKGVPQGRHIHALLSKGAQILEGWLPGLTDELVAEGAVRIDLGTELRWSWHGYVMCRYESGGPQIWATRPFIEHHVRRRVAALPNVTITSSSGVDGLLTNPGGAVRGVVDTRGSEIPAELVVDCSGRVGRSVSWLAALGCPEPPVDHVKIDMAYSTITFDADQSPEDGWQACLINTGPPLRRLAFMGPAEGGRTMLTVAGFHADHPPSDPEGLSEFVASFPDQYIGRALARAGEVGSVTTHRMASNQWRRMNKLAAPPPGVVALGDSVVSFDPVYGQGMTSSVVQAQALGEVIREVASTNPSFPKRFYRRQAKVITPLWQMAAGGDFDHPETTGPKPPGATFANWYQLRMVKAMVTSEAVSRVGTDVFTLLAPPYALFKPSVLGRVLTAHAEPQFPATAPGAAQLVPTSRGNSRR